MVCKDCQTKPLARGIKNIVCFCCGEKTMVNVRSSHVCTPCSDAKGICEYCCQIITTNHEKDYTKWKTKDGIELEIKDMTREHIMNCVAMIALQNPKLGTPTYEDLNYDVFEPYLVVFKNELMKRE